MSNYYHDPNDTRVPYGQQPQQPQQPQAWQQPQQPAGWRAQAYQPPVYQQPAPVQVNVNVAPAASSRSYFDGKALQLFGLHLVNFFIVVLTLGICAPWAICRKYKWTQKHTVIEGRRLAFDGTAVGLFGIWIKIWVLTLITAGIYSFRAGIELQKWIIKHTYFDA